ncbi:MAG: flagellar biosynthesis anti-sigma factor FlgM [Candidatus Brocadia sp.]|jgi:anti-sigma28 factor (negative regulator of flagellin synthesis)
MPIEDISKTSLHHGAVSTNRIEINHLQAGKVEKEDRLVDEKFDSVDISKEARDLKKSIKNLKSGVGEIPDVRAAKLEEVKAKLENGFYDRPEVIEQVAKKVAEAFSIKK